MVIEFKTEEEFTRLLDALAQELVDANIHWKLYRDITAKRKDYSREYSQAWTFWSLTFHSHAHATLFRLIRIYDANKQALSLRNLLDTILVNLDIFDVERFRERMKGNPFVESLAEDARKPDKDQLRKDIEFVSGDGNPLVENLIILRNNLFAHRNAKNEVEGYQIASDYPLSDDEIETLAVAGMDILNRYVTLFRASSFSTDIVGRDDYQSVLNYTRFYLEQRDREMEEERKRIEAAMRKNP